MYELMPLPAARYSHTACGSIAQSSDSTSALELGKCNNFGEIYLEISTNKLQVTYTIYDY